MGKLRRFTIEQEQQICQQYLTKLPDNTWNGAKTISKHWGTIPQTIYNILQRYHIPTRTIRQALAGKQIICSPRKVFPGIGDHNVGEAPFCSCGCGRRTNWNRNRGWSKFIHNHHRPTKKEPVKLKCEVCGEVFYVTPCRRYTARSCSRRCHNTRIGIQMPRAFTRIEHLLASELKKSNIKYQMNTPIGVGIRPDFTLVDYPICIEADGDYWHSLEWRKEYDRKRDERIVKLGYKVFHFAEHEIKSSPKECINKVLLELSL